jgi:hypothetical protein
VYVLIFLIVWIPAIVHRGYNFASGEDSFWLALMSILMVTQGKKKEIFAHFSGLIVAIVYSFNEHVFGSCSPKVSELEQVLIFQEIRGMVLGICNRDTEVQPLLIRTLPKNGNENDTL